MALNRCRKPFGKLVKAGNAIEVKGWEVIGWRNEQGDYYEECRQIGTNETRWYRLDDDDGDDI